MPHDARGLKINIGDSIKTKPLNFQEEYVVGRVVKMHSTSQQCTGEVRFIGMGQLDQDYFNADDSVVLLRADGTEPSEEIEAEG